MKTPVFLAACLCVLSACTVAGNKTTAIDYADPFVGTGFHGHTYPGATLPFGSVQLSPDTRKGNWDACSGYHYSDSTLFGFSHTHLSGTGCIDLGDVLLRPTSRPVALGDKSQPVYSPAVFSHQNETARPGYYAVYLEDEDIKAELSATAHAGIHRYTFHSGNQSSVIVDLAHLLDNEFIYEAQIKRTGGNEISGMRRTRGWVDNQYVFFTVRFSEPIQQLQLIKEGEPVSQNDSVAGTHLLAVASFGEKKTVLAKVGISIVSEANARENLEKEIPAFDFETVRSNAENTWKKALAVVEVKGGTEEQRKNFYTAWYHAMVVPNQVNDVNGEYRRHDMTIGKVAEGRKMFSTFSTWDTFRGWHPLMTLTDTVLVNDMVNSFIRMYDASGELPLWPLSAGETNTMIGYHSASIIADAYLKGIRGFDAEKALAAMVKSSEINKKGADYYIKYGFIPANIKKESVSCLLEFAYDDWCIAQMAKAMGKKEIYETYIARSQNYINVFDGLTKFFRGKRMDGNWMEHFNPYEVGRDYTEATAWQYRFFVPHDINGMIQQFGGVEAFGASLDSLFVVSSEMDGELSDITGLIGQYAHGNEPSHHMAYLYNYIGKPWLTQAMTRRLLDEMYAPTPEGIIGNEDCGQMSAWYILSAMGFYPVCPGSNEFVLTTPLFDEVKLLLANGKQLLIKAEGSLKKVYVDEVRLNGQVIDKNYVTYNQLMEGGVLEFVLTDKPNLKRGTGVDAFPYSYTKESVVAMPYVDRDLNLFMEHVDVNLGSATTGARIYYTLDGSEPTENSQLYKGTLSIDKTTTIKARAFKAGYVPSRIFTIEATKAVLEPALTKTASENGTSYTYFEGYYQTVNDLKKSRPVGMGIMKEPSIKEAPQADHFGYIFEGLINVPEDGVYTFATKSDDGSVLYIGDTKVVDNDGSHAAISASGKIALKKGLHAYRLLYFEDYEGEELGWEWMTPDARQMETIPADVLFIK